MSVQLKTKSVVVAVIVLAACLILALFPSLQNNSFVDDPDMPIEGTWKQASTYGYYDGGLSNTSSASNDITITESDSSHLICEQRGCSFLAVRDGRMILWKYQIEDGSSNQPEYFARCTYYGSCIVVNEIVKNIGVDELTYVSCSVYTRSGEDPYGFTYWEDEVDYETWNAYSAACANPNDYLTLSGSKLNFICGNGPLFKAEMTQLSYGAQVTNKLVGVFIEQTNDYARALVIDEDGDIWTMYYDGKVVYLSSILDSETVILEGQTVVVQRSYIEAMDITMTRPADPVVAKGDTWTLTSYVRFDSNGVHEIPLTGSFTIFDLVGTGFCATGLIDGVSVDLFGYVTPSGSDGVYFLGCGFLPDCTIGGCPVGYGTLTTNGVPTLTFSLLGSGSDTWQYIEQYTFTIV